MLLALTHDGTVVRLESRHLKIEGTDGTETISGIVPLCHLDRVVVSGRVQLSGSVVEALMSRGISLVLVSCKGDCEGVFHPFRAGDAERRRRQYRFDAASDLRPARRLLEAKLRNQMRVLQRLAAARHRSCEATAGIRMALRQLPRCSDLAGLRGIEGTAAAGYFGALGDFVPAWCDFGGRRRRPPADPFNAVLSYGYAVMSGELGRLILLHGLDPAVGFLHCDQYGVPVLTQDLLEPLRAGFCDMLALGLLTHRRLRPEHFEKQPKGGGVRLNSAGRRIFFEAWERKRLGTLCRADGKVVGWQNIWDAQVTTWLSFLMHGTGPEFFRMP